MQKYDYCHVKLSEEFNEILNYNQDQDSMTLSLQIWNIYSKKYKHVITYQNKQLLTDVVYDVDY